MNLGQGQKRLHESWSRPKKDYSNLGQGQKRPVFFEESFIDSGN